MNRSMNVVDLFERVLACADGDHVRVVVLARELRRGDAPHECGTDAAHLVRGDLLAVARSAEDDAERVDARLLIAHHGLRGTDAEGRVVIERVVVDGTVIDDIVTLLGEVMHELRRELEAGVVGRDVDAHGSILGGAGQRVRGSGRSPIEAAQGASPPPQA